MTSSSPLRWLVALMVVIMPLTALAVDKAHGTIFYLLALGGLGMLVFSAKTRVFSRDEKLLFFSVTFFFLLMVMMMVIGLDGDNKAAIKQLSKFIHLLLMVPVYLVFRRYPLSPALIWYGLAGGAMIAGVAALFELSSHVTGEFRARGATHPILFGDLSLVIGMMTLAGFGFFKSQRPWLVIVPIAAVLLGVLASLLSGSRGGWLALPVLALMLFWYVRPVLSARQRWGMMALALLFPLVVYLIPATGVKHRVDTAVAEVQSYATHDVQSTDKVGSSGARLEMWRAAITIFMDAPMLGAGLGNYQKEKQYLIDQGIRHPDVARYGNPHNQYLSTLSNTGLIGLMALLLVFLIPLRLFYGALRLNPYSPVGQLGFAGMILIVAYMHFALTESIFERNLPGMFFVFYVALLMAVIKSQRQSEMGQTVARANTLSVIVIAQDEADRIEACLKAVQGWADEIIVLDSGSRDNTVALAKKYTDQVYETDWPGYGPQKQRALEKASKDWVLSLDADEVLTAELCYEIDVALQSKQMDYVAYRLPIAVVIYGQVMDFGQAARAHLRLFQREGTRFSDAAVHENVILPKGKVARLHGRFLHDSYRDYKHSIDKFGQNAWLWAKARHAKGKRAGVLTAIVHAVSKFLMIYLVRLGCLDGRRGLLMAIIYAQYTFNKYSALWTLGRSGAKK